MISILMAITISIPLTSVVSVYDADTFRVNLPCSLPITCYSVPIRAEGFDAPEIRGKCDTEKKSARIAKYSTEEHHLKYGTGVEYYGGKRRGWCGKG